MHLMMPGLAVSASNMNRVRQNSSRGLEKGRMPSKEMLSFTQSLSDHLDKLGLNLFDLDLGVLLLFQEG